METQIAEGQWVCFVQGTRLPADQCPPDAKRHYMVDYVTYDSPEAYAQIQANNKIQGAASQARFNSNPAGYPPCTNDPPMGPEDQCGNESCDLHNILWLEFEGCTHEQAIGLTAVYNRSEDWGHGLIADTLGGMDEFNKLNEDGTDIPGMSAWYDSHLPLVQYFMESRESDSLLEYWLCAKYPGRYMPTNVTIYMVAETDGQGGWQPVPGPENKLWSTDENEAWGWGFDNPENETNPNHPSRNRKLARFTFDSGRGY